jgi:hypothetical protein
VWGSYSREEGLGYQPKSRFYLTRPSEFPFLVVNLAGYPRAPGNRLVVDYGGGKQVHLWRTEPGLTWLDRRFPAGPGGEPVLLAEDSTPDSWFAFSEPRELGFFSFYALWLTKWYDRVAVLGLLLLLAMHFVRRFLFPGPEELSLTGDWRRLRASWGSFLETWKHWKPEEPPPGN